MAQPMDTEDPRQQSLGELVKRLAEQTSRLIRQELRLARAEMTEKAQGYSRGAAMLGAAAFTALLTGVALTLFLVYLLRLAMPLWAAALIVTVVYGVVAFALFKTGQTRLKEAAPPVPEETIDNVKEDVGWLKTRTRSDAR
jgi:uncharacterized membrane protein YqjE